MAFPTIIFVHEETDTDGTKFLVTYRTPQEAVVEDGPTLVGTYKLVNTRRLTKTLRELPRRRRGQRDA